eukprot:tig00020563_g11370.t1
MQAAKAATAAALIIGDEILTGKTQDKNIKTFAEAFFDKGIVLKRVEVVPDDQEVIVEAVRRLSASCDYVVTSGGIGPTHDDITYDSIAAAFGVSVEIHEPTRERMAVHYAKQDPPMELNAARLRMAQLPAGCRVLWTPGLWVPLAVVRNVYIFPGIPSLTAQMLHANLEDFKGGLPRARVLVYTHQPEGEIADALTETARAFPDVAIGSYPGKNFRGGGAYRVKVSFEGIDAARVEEAASRVQAAVHGFREVDPELAAAETH